MTQPRMLLPGTTYLITRRTVRRHHLFRPGLVMNNIFLYCLFAYAKPLSIEVNAAVLMSNHEHLVVTDPNGTLSVFLSRFHKGVAMCTKVLRKWRGSVWDAQETSVVALLSPQAIVEKIAYLIANPASAHLVQRSNQWPGVHTTPRQLHGQTRSARKPKVYFNPKNQGLPKAVEARFCVPQAVQAAYTLDGGIEAIRQEVRRLERTAHIERLKNRSSVVGVAQMLALCPHSRATSAQPLRSRNPSFAVGKGQAALYRSAVRQLRAFRSSYRGAYLRWKSGDRQSEFPLGTFWMRYAHQAVVLC